MHSRSALSFFKISFLFLLEALQLTKSKFMIRRSFTTPVPGLTVSDVNFNFSCFVHNRRFHFLQVWCPTVFVSVGHCPINFWVSRTLCPVRRTKNVRRCLVFKQAVPKRPFHSTLSLGTLLMVLSGRSTRSTLRDLMVLRFFPALSLHTIHASNSLNRVGPFLPSLSMLCRQAGALSTKVNMFCMCAVSGIEGEGRK